MLTLETLSELALVNGAQKPAPGVTPVGTVNVADAGNLGSPAAPGAPKPTSGAVAPPLIFPILIADPTAERVGSTTRAPGSTATVLRPEPRVGVEFASTVGAKPSRGVFSINRPPLVLSVLKSRIGDTADKSAAVVATTTDRTPAEDAKLTSRTPLVVGAALLAGAAWVFAS